MTNCGSFAGKTSFDYNRDTALHENLSVMLLQSRESLHPYLYIYAFCRLEVIQEQVLPGGKEVLCVSLCHNYDDIAVCGDVNIFVMTSPDFVHQETYGVTPLSELGVV